MKTFSQLGLAEPILRALENEGYNQPTPIQSKAIPVALSGQDMLGIAQTGTGKTASFVLPILHEFARKDKRPTPKACDALILAPTRELVSQIAQNIRKYSKHMRVSVTVVIGGVKPLTQVRKLASGSHIIVATPGRLLDHLRNGHFTLSHTRTVILDEADHMLDLGFIPDIRRIMKQLPKSRQTSLFSATMPPQIRALTSDFQSNPVEIAVATESKPIERIAQSVRHVPQSAKHNALVSVVSNKDVDRAIVFTRTKRGADRVSRHLEQKGLSAIAIHGNKSQGQRVRALAGFKSGETTIMVATDIAARGIDIDDVSHVVNFDLPEVAEAYVHRIGRTARAGRTGVAVSFCDPSEAKSLRDIEKLIGSKIPIDGSEPAPVAEQAQSTEATRSKQRSGGPKRNAKPDRTGQRASKRRGEASGTWSPHDDSSASKEKNGKPSSNNRNRRYKGKTSSGSWRGKRASQPRATAHG